MKKNIFAICDLEVEYAENFLEYLNRKRNIPFEIRAFTTRKALLEFAKDNRIELLLISQRAMCREVCGLETGRIVILSEGIHSSDLERYPNVYKYQSSAEVVREVMACYGKSEPVLRESFPVLKKKTEILGVYSPLKRCLKTSFALALGQILAGKKAVLYLNLEEYSGFEQLVGMEYKNTLSDLLYYVKQENRNLIHQMNGMVMTVGNMDYIPPAKMPWDVKNVTLEEWNFLLDQICAESSYEVVLLDLGCETEETFRLLERCRRIYMPVLSDKVSLCKIAQFEKLLKVWDFSSVAGKIVKVQPPCHRNENSREPYVNGLVFSELGDYVRAVLRKENRQGE